jgi:hypothetical protein
LIGKENRSSVAALNSPAMHSSPNRPVLLALLMIASALLGAGSAGAQTTEYIVVSGGPALREWEDLRAPGQQHDRWWGNFVRSARVRMQEIKKVAPPGTIITWLVYRDAYLRRSSEDRQPLTSFVESVRDTYGVRLVWYRSGADVINYINSGMNRRSVKVSGFEYFGHSNKFCFMFDYSSDVYGASTSWLHETDLRRIRSSAFAPNAYCHSWGCHTAESMSAEWKRATGLTLVGAYGKTDYSNGHLTGWKVQLAPGASWRRR